MLDAASEPRASFFVSGGTVPLGAASYVARDADRALFEALREGKYCYVLTSRQMGKSSLSVRTMEALREEGVRTAFVDLTRVGGRNVTAEQWYAGILGEVGRGLGNRAALLGHWKAHPELGPMQRFFGALREVALAAHGTPPSGEGQGWGSASGAARIVVFIDEIDATKSLPFSTDEFFAGIRECFNRRVQDPAMARLSFCLIGVAIPSDLMSDAKLTPFNVGERIVLRDFSPKEALALSAGLSGTLPSGGGQGGGREERSSQALIERIVHWTGGHPFLTQSLGRRLAEEPSPLGERVRRGMRSGAPQVDGVGVSHVDRLVAEEFFEARARETNINLADVGNRVLNSYDDPNAVSRYRADVLSLYERIVKGKRIEDDESNRLVAILKLAGLVKAEGGLLKVRNRIYAQVFGVEWIREQMPNQELRRQRAAFRLGMVRASALAAAVVVAMALLASAAVRSDREARAALAVARRERTASERSAALAQAAEAVAKESAASRLLALQQATAATARANGLATARTAALGQAQHEKARADAQTRMAELRRAEAEVAKSRALASATEARLAQGFATEQRTVAQRESQKAKAAASEAQTQAHEAYVNGVGSVGLLLDQGETEAAEPLLRLLRRSPSRNWEVGHLDQRFASHLSTSYLAHRGIVEGIGYADNGRTIVTSGHDGRLGRWPVDDPAAGSTFDSPSARAKKIRSIGTMPGTSEVVALSNPGHLERVDIETRRVRWARDTGDMEPNAVAISADGSRVATCAEAGRLRFFRASDGMPLGSFTAGNDALTSVVFAPGGESVAVASADGLVHLVGTDGRMRRSFDGTKDLNSVAFSKDGQSLAAGGPGGVVRVWAKLGGLIAEWKEGSDVIALVSSTRSPGWIVAAAGSVTLRSPSGAKLALDPQLSADDEPESVALAPDGGQVVVGQKSGAFHRWSPGEEEALGGRLLTKFDGIASAITATSDGSRLYTVCGDKDGTVDPGLVRAIDASTGKVRWTVRLSGRVYLGATTTADGSLVAVDCFDKETTFLLSGEDGHTLASMPSNLQTPRFSPDGRLLLSGMADSLALYDARTLRLVRPIQAHGFCGVAFSPNGRSLAIAQQDGTVAIVRVADGRLIRTLIGLENRAYWLAYSPDGRRLLATGPDGLRVWIAESGHSVVNRRISPGVANSGVFSPDGSRIFTTADGAPGAGLQVCDAETGRRLMQVKGPDLGGRNVVVASNGTVTMSCYDGSVVAFKGTDRKVEDRLSRNEVEEDRRAALDARDQERRSAAKAREVAIAERVGPAVAQARAAVLERAWERAVTALDPALRAVPEASEARRLRATSLAWLGRYTDAERDLVYLADHPDAANVEQDRYQLMVLSGAMGHEAEFARMRRILLVGPDAGRRSTTARYLSAVGVFGEKLSPSDRDVLRRAAAPPEPFAAKSDEGHYWFTYSSSALVRLGRPAEALDRLQRIEPFVSADSPIGVFGSLVAVLAHAQVGDFDSARARWEKLVPLLRKQDDDVAARKPTDLTWTGFLIQTRLRRDIERLLSPSPGTIQPSSAALPTGQPRHDLHRR